MKLTRWHPYAFGILRLNDLKTIFTVPENGMTSTEQQYNIDLAAEAVNSCIELNPDNPLAVAENIKQAIDVLRDVYKWLEPDLCKLPDSVRQPMEQVLNKIGVK